MIYYDRQEVSGNDGVWHYDGTSWKSYGAHLSSNHFSIFGFAQNDAWMTDAPDGVRIWHFDGASWKLFGTYYIPHDLSNIYLRTVWGDAPNNLYAAGTNWSTDHQ